MILVLKCFSLAQGIWYSKFSDVNIVPEMHFSSGIDTLRTSHRRCTKNCSSKIKRTHICHEYCLNRHGNACLRLYVRLRVTAWNVSDEISSTYWLSLIVHQSVPIRKTPGSCVRGKHDFSLLLWFQSSSRIRGETSDFSNSQRITTAMTTTPQWLSVSKWHQNAARC